MAKYVLLDDAAPAPAKGGYVLLDDEPAKPAQKKAAQWADLPSNIIPSASNFVGGIASAVAHPVDTAKSLALLGSGAVQKVLPQGLVNAVNKAQSSVFGAGVNDLNVKAQKAASDVGQLYKQRYGGLENAKETLINDPVGAAADLSTILSGGAVASAKAPALAAALKTAAKVTNPLSVVAPVARGAGAVAGGTAKNLLGFTTGTGAENVANAFKAGQDANPAFMQNLTGQVSAAEVLDKARQGLQTMRQTRGGAYREGIATTAADQTPLNFTPVDKALNDVVDSMQYGGKWKIGQPEVAKINELSDIVGEWKADPSLHTPMGMDALKQRLDALYPESPMHNQAQRAITSVRNSVKDTIVNQSPEYAKTMADYEKALSIENEIKRALSLGNKASQDTAIRKLQSLGRNNVNTNYGNRMDLAKALEEGGGVDIMPSIAGQSMSSWHPRGLQGLAPLMVGGAAYVNPMALSLLPFQSPKLVGGATYGLGRAAGAIEGAANKVPLTPAQLKAQALLMYQANQANQASSQ